MDKEFDLKGEMSAAWMFPNSIECCIDVAEKYVEYKISKMDNPNDLEQLNNSYISEVSEMSMWEDLLIQKQKEIDMLRQQVHTLQEINNVLLGIKPKLD
jgi:hypothetical protein